MSPAGKERAAVVAWLRRLSVRLVERAEQTPPTRSAIMKADAQLVAGAANAIERGEHRHHLPKENDT